ncbi:hypothetical protein V1477_012709 [Vespula maculifrons]|uniref:Uncharacterized protein n=3 Tax=Vespula TaxID=7451 RepID=A0A834JSP5_VESVU|nr:hypothetical protein HZH66_008709 [Vespula vulgaris]
MEDRRELGRGCWVMLGDGDEVNDRPRLEVRGVQCMKPAVIATLLQSNLQGAKKRPISELGGTVLDPSGTELEN